MIATDLVTPLILEAKKQMNPIGIGKGLNTLIKNTMKKIIVPLDIYDFLPYKNMSILADENNYLIVQDESVLYMGYIDNENIFSTVVQDLSDFPELINIYICLANEDASAIIDLMERPGFNEAYSKQLINGYQKGRKNGHY